MDVGFTPTGKSNNLFHFFRIHVMQFPCIEYHYFTQGIQDTLTNKFQLQMYAGNCGTQQEQTNFVPTDASGKEIGESKVYA